MIDIIINGVCGKMGRRIADLALSRPAEFNVVAGVDIGAASSDLPFPVYRSIFDVTRKPDVVVDFSRPQALPGILAYCKVNHVAAVLATTGTTPEDSAMIDEAAQDIPIFRSANMALGVNLQLDFVKRAAVTLGDAFDIEILEKHHNTKVDAPSGTALMLADGISAQFPRGKRYVYGRNTVTQPRSKDEIGLLSMRGGTIVGEHQVHFIGTDEMLQITHIAQSRNVFASGALTAVKFIAGKPPKLYDMMDIVTAMPPVTHMYTDEDQAVFNISGVEWGKVAGMFKAMADQNINIDMICQTAPKNGSVDVSFSLPGSDIAKATAALEKIGVSINSGALNILDDVLKVTIAGMGMPRQSGIAAKLFDALVEAKVDILLITTSETQISYCIHSADMARAVSASSVQFGL
jgi:4-hydroxy-tetrahydrodipicolinate reductase